MKLRAKNIGGEAGSVSAVGEGDTFLQALGRLKTACDVNRRRLAKKLVLSSMYGRFGVPRPEGVSRGFREKLSEMLRQVHRGKASEVSKSEPGTVYYYDVSSSYPESMLKGR